ncbi:MAG: ATP-binding protein [Planctomycetales bacterium]|nr:ATP-binding protein [Planctomycetales bacterium]
MPVAALKLVVANKVVESHELKERTLVGRSRNADVLLADPLVSREHAVVIREGDRYVVADLGSANGIMVNHRKTARAALVEGDLVTVGNSLFVFTHETLATDPERTVELPESGPLPAGSWESARDVELWMPSRLEAVERVGDALRRLLRASCLAERDAQHLHLSLLEALTNAHRHGNQGDEGKRIALRLQRSENRVVARVRDEGTGFDFRHALSVGRSGDAVRVARARYEAGRPGGLGIMLMVRSVDLVEFNESGSEVTLVKCPADVFQAATIYGGLGFSPETPPPLPGEDTPPGGTPLPPGGKPGRI